MSQETPRGTFLEWISDAYPLAYGRLYMKLMRNGVAQVDAAERAERAVSEALSTAATRIPLEGYFPDYRAFVVWTILVGDRVLQDSQYGLPESDLPDPDDGSADEAAVLESLSDLPPETRIILCWRSLDGLTDAEISVGLQLEESEVARARVRGLQMIQSRISTSRSEDR